jgi:hypothetical protein
VFRRELEAGVPELAAELARFVQQLARAG